MLVAEINEVDGVLVSRHNIRHIFKFFREERFQVCCVGVVARVINFLRFDLGVSVYDEDTCLVPDGTQVGFCADNWANLSDILA